MAASFTTIGAVTVPNPEFRFVYDVRLSQYPDDPDNLALAKAYQWTNLKIGRDERPSVQVLVDVCNAFEFQSEENRRVLLATYGHGKSHLALALANFFGQSAGSEPVEAVINGVAHVAPGIASRLRSFKDQKAPYLILRLVGGESDSLSAAVVRGLEVALKEHPTTKDAELDLWFDEALRVLDTFSSKEKDDTTAFLDVHASTENLDFGALRATLDPARRDGRYRQLIHQVVHHVRGVYPHFDAALSPRDLLVKVASKFCGEGKPFAGILILFDEFAAFVEAYAKQYGLHTESLPLQSLLDGVSHLRQHNQAVFLAFAQQDPDLVAELAMQERGAGASTLKDLKKELTRLPSEGRSPLYSPMEAVLDAYLKQDKNIWDELTPDDSVADNDVIDSVDAVRNFFPQRYTDSAGWTLDKIRTTIAYGCHPLHPLTTALLCSATLRAGTAARTVLSFVKDIMQHYSRRPALGFDGRLCWVRPIELVKYYQRQLVTEDAWKRYDNTRIKAGPAAIDGADAILQGMLLYESAGFRPGDTTTTDYIGTLAVLTGLTRPDVERALHTLCEIGGYIEKDAVSNTYRFWPIGQDGSKLRQTLLDQVVQLRRDPVNSEIALSEGLDRAALPKIEELTFHNTNGVEWGARVLLVPRTQWTTPNLFSLLRAQGLETNGHLTDAARGYVLLPLAADDAEMQWLRQHAASTLDTMLADNFSDRSQIPPIVLVLPKKPHEGLFNVLLELHILDSLPPSTKRNLGEEPVKQRYASLQANLINAAQALKEELSAAASWEVPAHLRAGVAERISAKRIVNLSHILQAAYETAYYRFAPYLGDSTRANKLREAVGLAVTRLYRGSFLDWDEATRANNLGRARDLYNKVLRRVPGAWGVVDLSDRVVDPQLTQVKYAWEVLEAAVPAGSENVRLRPSLLQLLNAPFGYDSYALSLLFAAWYGVNRYQLKLTSAAGRPLEPKDWLGTTNDFKAILEGLMHHFDVRATRLNLPAGKGLAQELLAKLRYRESLSLADAEKAVADLRDYASQPDAEPQLRQEAEEGARQLEYEVQQALTFEQRINEATTALNTLTADANGVRKLIELHQLFSNPTVVGLPLGSVIPPAQATLSTNRHRVAAKLRQNLTEVCQNTATISSIKGYDLARQRLDALRAAVVPLGEPDLESRIQDAEQMLEEQHVQYTRIEQDGPIREKLSEARRAATLAEWRELLAFLNTVEPQAEATRQQVEDVIQKLTTRQLEAEQWLFASITRAEALTDTATINTFTRDLARHLDQFKGTPEADTLKQLEARADRASTLVKQLDDLRGNRPKTADALRTAVRDYETLAARTGWSLAQVERIQEEQAKLEGRFAEQRQAASTKLADLVFRNTAGESAAVLLSELETRLSFLPDEEKIERNTLEKALRRRMAQDKAALTEKAFLDIANRSEQKACLVRLHQLLETITD
ncbi:hypothetical protein [Fibrella aquatica]|uniref:hypothetical protein n=1 Tax=Fibrella aquatica TaxID=3242487 RepID=UPI003522E6BA